jgi:acyl-coenzyme A synthetase/AMP-(fatty) acid ligase
MWVRSDSSAPMYLEPAGENARDDGVTVGIWSGDRFHEDEEGFYYFEGRADDLIKVSGQWVAPAGGRTLSRRASGGSGVRGVGVEDANRLMTVEAWVVLKGGAKCGCAHDA